MLSVATKNQKEIGTEFFSALDPRYIDEIKSQRSSTKFRNGKKDMVLEDLHRHDVEQLDKVIRDNK